MFKVLLACLVDILATLLADRFAVCKGNRLSRPVSFTTSNLFLHYELNRSLGYVRLVTVRFCGRHNHFCRR
jgi:hypothetical protein